MPAPDYDLVVVGAGIHGAGVAQAAAAAGYTVLVLEQTAPAAGTSSRSSKLIHGGLRYLESAQFALVREALAERERLLRLAPGLVTRVPFHIPVYADSRRGPWRIRAGLALYALLAGLGPHVRFESLPRRRWTELDGLKTLGLRAVFRYEDAQTDDASLVRAVLRSAVRLGARFACPARFVAARRTLDAYEIRYVETGREAGCTAHALVNAAGPWADQVAAAIAPAPPRPAIELVQGAHVILAGSLRQGIYYVEAPADRRPVFVMPWRGAILLGTTETPFVGDPALAAPRPHEIEYLCETFRRYFPDRPVQVLDAYAGLRVLPADGGPLQRRSRETLLVADDPARARLVTIYGGKLTTYRATAARVLRLLEQAIPTRPAPRAADTAELPLEEGDGDFSISR